MEYTRKIRVEYYQVVKANIDETGEDKIFDLRTLIVKANRCTLEERTYQYYQEYARLDKMKYYETLDIWYLNFVRLRQTKIPVMAKATTEAESMHLAEDEYIGEDVTAVYDCKNNILALQRNRDSLSSTGLQEYLTHLYDTDGKGIFLRPFELKNVFEKAKNVSSYRKIALKFASAKNKVRRNVEASSFHGLFGFFDRFETSQNAVVSISLGRGKKGSLDKEAMSEIIRDIKELEGVVTGAELSVKEREDAPTEIIDLFAMKYHSFITLRMEERESIDYIECGNAIYNAYKTKRDEILNTLGA